jgi:hypothetical protein
MIFYAKAQLASDLDVTLRRYAKVDPRFPNYSTARLFLRDDQFKSLVALGRAAGARLSALVGEELTVAPGAEDDTTTERVTTKVLAVAAAVETTMESGRADVPTG